jgi:hypothetical protein
MMQQNEPIAPGAKRRIVTIGGTKRRVDRSNLQQQLGAAISGTVLHRTDTPLGFVAVRQELIEKRRSTGGRPGFANAERRKIPVAESVWRAVSDAAAEMAEPGFRPSPAQVASAILSVAVHRLGPELKRETRHALTASRSLRQSAWGIDRRSPRSDVSPGCVTASASGWRVKRAGRLMRG